MTEEGMADEKQFIICLGYCLDHSTRADNYCYRGNFTFQLVISAETWQVCQFFRGNRSKWLVTTS